MPVEGLRVERGEGGRVDVVLDRPARKNAVTPAMWPALREVFGGVTIGRDRVVVLRGEGGAFCSGADLSPGNEPDGNALDRMAEVNDACAAIRACPVPTIAQVEGVAYGAGMNLALLCDLVVAAEDARFCQVFARRGLSVDCGGSWTLPRLAGDRAARELLLLGDEIDGRRADALGMLTRCVPAAEVAACVDELAERLAAGPPLALALDKRLLNRTWERSFEEALEGEAVAQALNLETDDVREAFAAFQERRPPRFTGR